MFKQRVAKSVLDGSLQVTLCCNVLYRSTKCSEHTMIRCHDWLLALTLFDQILTRMLG